MSSGEPSLQAIFSDAVDIGDPAERAAFLESACAGRADVRRRVEALLAADGRAGRFLCVRTPRPEMEPAKVGDRIGRYRILGRLGQGGYGAVYLAEQEEPVRREVALKIIKLGMDTGAVVARFELERQALAMMEHPNIARVLDAGATDSGRPYFVMELVRGESITEYCRRRRLSLRQRLELFIGICQAVQHAHQKGIIHRDVKPSNILVTENDGRPTPKIIDFGIAKATERGGAAAMTAAHDIIGTPAYMSPEQVTPGRRDIDTRCDIYGLGVVLYELVAGQPPFDSKVLDRAGLEEIHRIIRDVDPARPSTRILREETRSAGGDSEVRQHMAALRNDVDWIVMKCLEKDRTRRYQTADELAADLRRHLDHEPVNARAPSAIYRLEKLVRRNRLVFGAAGIITAVLLASVVASSRSALRATQAERLAQAKAAESEDRLLRRFVAEGNRLLEQNRAHAALPLLVEALARERNPARQAEGRVRLALALDGAPQLRLHAAHGREVYSVALSPDGAWLATGADDGAVHLSSVASGGGAVTRLSLGGPVTSLAFSPDGTLLAAASRDGWRRIWEIPGGRAVTEPIRSDGFDGAAVRRLETKLAPTFRFGGGSDRLLFAWGTSVAQWIDARTGVVVREFDHGGLVWHAALSKSGRYVATSGNDGKVRLWKTETGESVGTALQHRGMVAWSEFSPDETQLLTVRDRRAVQIWDWSAGRRLGPEVEGGSVIFSARFSPRGGTYLTAYWSGNVRLYDAGTDRMRAEFQQGGGVVGAVFSPSGDDIAVAAHDGQVWVWNALNPRLPAAVLPMGDAVNSVAFSPDGARLAGGARGGRARVWDLADARRHLRSVPASDGRVVAWDGTGGQFLVAGGSRGADVRFYDAAGGKRLGGARVSGSPATMARYSPDSTRALVMAGNRLHVFETNGAQSFPPITHGSPVLHADWLQDGRSILTAAQVDGIRTFNAADGRVSATFNPGADLTAFALSADGATAATAHAGRVIRVFAVGSNLTARASWPVPYQVTRLRFDPGGRRLGIAGEVEHGDGLLEIRELPGGRVVAHIPSRNTLNAFAFSPDGRLVATASEDGQARVWDALTGGAVSGWMAHGHAVQQACFSPDGAWVATLGNRGLVRLWNARTGEPLTTFFDFNRDSGGFHGQFSPDGQRFLLTTGAQVAWLLELPPTGASLAQLRLQAQAFACHAMEPDGNLTPLDDAALLRIWEEFRSLRSGQP